MKHGSQWKVRERSRSPPRSLCWSFKYMAASLPCSNYKSAQSYSSSWKTLQQKISDNVCQTYLVCFNFMFSDFCRLDVTTTELVLHSQIYNEVSLRKSGWKLSLIWWEIHQSPIDFPSISESWGNSSKVAIHVPKSTIVFCFDSWLLTYNMIHVVMMSYSQKNHSC